jgi:hypothetical protein
MIKKLKFDDYLNNELKNSDFKNGYLTEKAILDSALTGHIDIYTINKLAPELGKNLQSALNNAIGGVIIL